MTMPEHVHSTHRIVVDAPLQRCFMLLTPAGEDVTCRAVDAHRTEVDVDADLR
jgi:hypothetical protein